MMIMMSLMLTRTLCQTFALTVVMLAGGSACSCSRYPSPAEQRERDQKSSGGMAKLRAIREKALQQRAAMDFQCAETEVKFVATASLANDGGREPMPYAADAAGCGKSASYEFNDEKGAWWMKGVVKSVSETPKTTP